MMTDYEHGWQVDIIDGSVFRNTDDGIEYLMPLEVENILNEHGKLEAEITDYLKICQNYVTDLQSLQTENAQLKAELNTYKREIERRDDALAEVDDD